MGNLCASHYAKVLKRTSLDLVTKLDDMKNNENLGKDRARQPCRHHLAMLEAGKGTEISRASPQKTTKSEKNGVNKV